MFIAAFALMLSDPVVIGSPPVAEPSLSGAAHAIEAGRLDQAKAMIAASINAGAKGEAVDRLMADLSYARGEFVQALASYDLLLRAHPDEALLLERAGISALKLGRQAQAVALLDRATRASGAGWRAWNARGVAADGDGRWDEASAAYARADQLSPGRAEVANNRGWSFMLQGRWADAVTAFDQAAAINPNLPRLAANIELARAATQAGLPVRMSGETDEGYAARLNDAGVVAQAEGDAGRARAAFAQAIELKSRWNARAAANLASVEGAK
nr:tetratricopeptide repeat protein [uncultured Sphingomonas sp.]